MFFSFLVQRQVSFVEGSCMVQSEFTTYQQMHHISLSYITTGCLPPFRTEGFLLSKWKAGQKYGHRFLQAVCLFVFEVTQGHSLANKISGGKTSTRGEMESCYLAFRIYSASVQSLVLAGLDMAVRRDRVNVLVKQKEMVQDTILPALSPSMKCNPLTPHPHW